MRERHPLFNEYIKFYKDFSNIEEKINEQNKVFIENQSSKYDVLNVAIQCETRKYMEKGKLL